jgi:hypothetical protein
MDPEAAHLARNVVAERGKAPVLGPDELGAVARDHVGVLEPMALDQEGGLHRVTRIVGMT